MASGFLGALPSLIGLATDVATAIPGLKKPKKRDTSQRAVRRASTQMQQSAIGASQTGFGASRGLALRSGLRAGVRAGREALDPAASAAYNDQRRFDIELQQRNQRLAQFGKDIAGTGAAMTSQIVENQAAKKAGAETAAAEAATSGLPAVTGYPGPGVPGQDPQEIQRQMEAQQAQAQVQQIQQDPTQQPPPAAAQGPSVQLQQRDPIDIYRASLGLPERPAMRLAPELEFKLRVENLAYDEMERQGLSPENFGGRLNRLMGNYVAPANPWQDHGTDPGDLQGFSEGPEDF